MGASQYTGVNWILTGISIALTVGRYTIRWLNSRKFHWDDLAHFVALSVLIAHGVTNQITSNAKGELATANATKGEDPNQLLHLYYHVRYLNTINNCLLYLVFWVVKFAFLLFYRFLFETSAPFRKAWWAVTAFVLLTFWVPIAGVLATCANVNDIKGFKACNSANHARVVKLEYSCVINVVTDLATIALPLWMLKDLKIKLAQKIGLAFVFSLATICVVLDIVRTVEAIDSNQALYTVLEINFVVIVSCLPTYRALLNLGQAGRSRKPSQYSSGSRLSAFSPWRRPSVFSSWKKMENGSWSNGQGRPNHHPSRDDLEDGIELNPGVIHTSQGFTISEELKAPSSSRTINTSISHVQEAPTLESVRI